MKSIKAQIVTVIFILVIILCLIFGIMSCYLNFSTAEAVLEQTLSETAVVSADLISSEVKSIKNVAIETGSTARLANSEIPLNEKKALIDQRANTYGFTSGDLLDTNGKSVFTNENYSNQEFFTKALNGEAYISDAIISSETNKAVFYISAPLWQGGIPNTEVVGVVYYMPNESFLSDIVANIQISETGYAYILSKDGTNVADKDVEKIGIENSIIDAKTDDTLKVLADIETKMTEGNAGFGKYYYEGATWIQSYAPISGTNNWSLGVAAIDKDFLGNFYLSLMITIVFTIIFVILGIIIAIWFANKLSKPIIKCVNRIKLLAEGDLETPAPKVNSKNETGILATTTENLLTSLHGLVHDVSVNLTEISNGNLNIKALRDFKGDFSPLSVATNNIVLSLNDALKQINRAAEEVNSGADHMAASSQALAQGATEQANSIEELSASIGDISSQIEESAENANNANNLSNEATKNLMASNAEMENLLNAMNEISASSGQIGNIIKTINDIAFQTNILALNAAVEAARAGAAGKGFAVVADEVRNLASKSADAVKDTTELIDGSLKAVENGKNISDSTATMLTAVMEKSKESGALISEISSNTGHQTSSLDQINMGIDQISGVVQTNSATAEESAAASEQLSGQANLMKELVARFNLREE